MSDESAARTRLERQRDDLTHRLDRLQAAERDEAALARVHSGEFGRCAICGNPIEAERLELIPEATRCRKHL